MDKQFQLDTDKAIEEMISKNGMTGIEADMMRKCKMGVCEVDDKGNYILHNNVPF